MILETILLSSASVAATLVTLNRVVKWKTILKYATVVDIGFTLGMLGLLSGTLGGAASAILAGLLMAVFLTVSRRVHKMGVDLKSAVIPANADADEYDAFGRWIYDADDMQATLQTKG